MKNNLQKKLKKLNIKVLMLVLCISILIISIGSKNILMIMEIINGKNTATSNFNRISDPNTMDSYKDLLLSDENGSRYAGRIWSDKTVLTNSLKLDMETDGYNGTITNNSNFLNVFSALGSSQAWIGLPPTKTVIVIDNSASMYSNKVTDWDSTRMSKTINAVNESIDRLMRAGAFNEVAVVIFGNGEKNGYKQEDQSTATVVVPMGHYEVSSSEKNPYTYLNAGWKDKNTSSEEGEFTEAPLTNPSMANTSLGYIYVDKRYVNDTFNVDNSISLSDKGTKRYDTYQNGTTNINAGSYLALHTLLQEETTVKVAGLVFNYIPSVVLLSDGAATDMLSGEWSNPILKSKGFTNDRGNKKASYIQEFEDPQNKYTFDWNMYMEIKNKNGVPTVEQVGYGNGTLRSGHDASGNYSSIANPDSIGEQSLKELADDVRSTQGAMILSTILNTSYMKKAVEKKYGENCKFYTISVDMIDPQNIKLPSSSEWFSGTADYKITTNPITMNPNNYFNLDWLQEKGYIKKGANLNNLTDSDFIYQPYTTGSETIWAMADSIAAYNEFKNNSNSYEARNKLKKYVVYQEYKGLWTDMKDGQAIINDTTYKATVPIGPNHGNAYFIEQRYDDIRFNNLNINDLKNNPYGLTNDDIDYNYVTKAYYAQTGSGTADKIAETFDEIVEDIVSSAFEPVSGINDIGVEDSMTYMDPVGQYMDVKDSAVTINDKTYDMGLLLFGEIYGITKTAVYDYTFNSTHRGENHDSDDMNLDFIGGWYDKDGHYLKNGGSWDNGDIYYVDSETVRKYVPNLVEEGKMTEQQKNTIYTLYRFLDENRNDDIHNPCYNDKNITYKLSDIRIWVEDTENFEDENSDAAIDLGFDKAIYANIPVSALPLQVANIKIGSDGHVASYSTNLDNKKITTPFRLFYGVGLQESIFTDDGLDVDIAKIAPEYLQKNKNGDIVYFYSNYYSNTSYDDYVTDTRTERTRGDAVLSFSPNETNRFYIYQNPLPLYNISKADGDLGENGTYQDVLLLDDVTLNAFKATHSQITDAATLDSNTWYYVIQDYYLPGKSDPVHVAVSRLGKEFGSGIAGGTVKEGNYLAWYNEEKDTWVPYEVGEEKPSDGNWVVATRPGGLRVGDMAQSLRAKSTNKTNTAYNYYLPTISHTTGNSSNDSDVVINSYLGNNGRLEINDSLMFLTKELIADDIGNQSVDKNKEFNFKVKLENHEGDYEALKVYKNPYSKEWQIRVSTIDVLTNNEGFLQNSNNDLTVYRMNNNRSYYIYIGNNQVSGEMGDSNVFRLYSAPDNDDGENLTKSGITTYVENPNEIDNEIKTDLNKYKTYDEEHRLGSIDFWIKEVYLIPTKEVDNGTWNGKVEGYQKIDEYVISHLDSYLFGSSELTSPYATKTSYLTQKVYFGYSKSNKPEEMPEGWDINEWNNQQENIAHIKLKDNEGLMFQGLNSNTKYEIEEEITEENEKEGYSFHHVDLAEGDNAEVEGKKVKGVVNDNYPDEVNYVNKYYAPVDMTINKKVLGSLGEFNKEWKFNIKLIPAENVVMQESYKITNSSIEGVEVSTKDSITLTKQSDGSYIGSVSLKHGQTVTIKGLPQDTKYEVEEVEANSDDYITTEENTRGTLNRTNTNINFENAKYSKHDITLTKEVLGEWGEKEKEWTFDVKLTPQKGIPFSKTYTYVGSKIGVLELTENKDGSYIGRITLKNGESVTIKEIPEGTAYEIEEIEANEKGYITKKENEKGILKESPKVEVKFTNINYSRHKLTIEKTVTGGAGEKEKEWSFRVILIPEEDVIFDESYPYVGGHTISGISDPTDGNIKLTKLREGIYEGIITLKHGQKITIENIPERTKYKVEEIEANQEEYITTSTVNTIGTLTKDEEIIKFINRKPSKHNLTISKEVAGNLGDKEKEWTFKISLIPDEQIELKETYRYRGSKEGTIKFKDDNLGSYVGTITLKDGESITIEEIPEGTTYKVEEIEANQEGYYTKTTGNVTGKLTGETPVVKFTNTKLSKHSLTVIKEIQGSDGDKEKEWNFKLTLIPNEEVKISKQLEYDGGSIIDNVQPKESGILELEEEEEGKYVAPFKLKHGESITIKDIPEGTTYKVEEIEANQEEYITVKKGEENGIFDKELTHVITYINKKPAKNNLVLGKEVSGLAGEKEKEWTFEITLKPDTYVELLEQYLYDGDKIGLLELKKQADGTSKGEITLKHGQTVTIRNLPENTAYKIREKEANQEEYITEVEGEEEGLLTAKETKINYKNTKLKKNNLIIKKYVSGDIGEKEKEWTFKIRLISPKIKKLETEYKYEKELALSEKKEEGTISLSEITEGIFETNVKLKSDESITIKEIPEGTQYEIEEIEANQEGYVTSSKGNLEGILEEKDQVIEFYNKKYSKYDLSIEKRLKGTKEEKEWTFKIKLKPKSELPFDTEYLYKINNQQEKTIEFDKQGEIYYSEIKLKGGEKVTIQGIPYETEYEIKEVEENKDGYTTTYKNKKGIVKSNVEITIINEKNIKIPLTLDNLLKYIMIFIVSIILTISLLIVKKKYIK